MSVLGVKKMQHPVPLYLYILYSTLCMRLPNPTVSYKEKTHAPPPAPNSSITGTSHINPPPPPSSSKPATATPMTLCVTPPISILYSWYLLFFNYEYVRVYARQFIPSVLAVVEYTSLLMKLWPPAISSLANKLLRVRLRAVE